MKFFVFAFKEYSIQTDLTDQYLEKKMKSSLLYKVYLACPNFCMKINYRNSIKRCGTISKVI